MTDEHWEQLCPELAADRRRAEFRESLKQPPEPLPISLCLHCGEWVHRSQKHVLKRSHFGCTVVTNVEATRG